MNSEIPFFQSPKIKAVIARHQDLAVLMSVFCLGALVYWKSFWGGFQFDDYFAIVDNPVIKQLDFASLWSYNKVRFLTNVSFALNYAAGGLKVFGWHLVNNILHFANSFLVYLLVRLTLQTPSCRGEGSQAGRNMVSLFTALIFLVHPAQTEAVTYSVQRATVLCGLFYLGTVYFYARARLENTFKFYAAAFICMLLGAVSKPTVITLPLSLVLYDLCFLNSFSNLRKGNVLFIVLSAIPIFVIPFFLLGSETLIEISQDSYWNISPGRYLLTQFNVIVSYLGLLIFPVRQNIDYDFPVAQNLFEFPTWLSLAALLLLVAAALRIFKSHRAVSFGILWFFIVLGPQSSIFSLADVIVEHRVYLPSLGLIFAACYVLYRAIRNPKIYIYALSAVIVIFSVLTYQRNDLWSRPIDFMEDTVRQSPRKARTHNNLGFLYYKNGELQKAERRFSKALQLDPGYFFAQQNLAMIYYETGRIKEAGELFADLIKKRPLFDEAYVGLAIVLGQSGERDKALFLLQEALRLNPRRASAYVGLGNILQEQGDLRAARDYLIRAARLNPDSPVIFYNLGNLDFQSGNLYEALLHYRKALRLNPDFSMARNNLGNIYFYFGDYPQAVKEYLQAVENDPLLASAYFNLANSFYELGNINSSRQAAQTALDLYRQQGRQDMVDQIENKLKTSIPHAP